MSSGRQRIRIRYEQRDIYASSARVYLNDIDISHVLYAFKIDVAPGCVPVMELSVRPDEIEIDTQTMAVLTAVLDSQKVDS